MARTVKCKRCGHKWEPRVSRPVKCPECSSQNWNKAKPKKKAQR